MTWTDVGNQFCRSRVHIGHICGAIGGLGCSHGHEMDRGIFHGRHVGRERQPGRILLEKLVETWLVKGSLAVIEAVNSGLVDVNTDNVVAEFCHRCGVDGTQVTAANDRKLHTQNPRGLGPGGLDEANSVMNAGQCCLGHNRCLLRTEGQYSIQLTDVGE